METFSALLAICAGNSPVSGEFLAQRPVVRNFDVFFDLHLNKRLSKQWRGWWFETPWRPLWRHCNGSIARCLLIVGSLYTNWYRLYATKTSVEYNVEKSIQIDIYILERHLISQTLSLSWFKKRWENVPLNVVIDLSSLARFLCEFAGHVDAWFTKTYWKSLMIVFIFIKPKLNFFRDVRLT